MPKLDPGTLKKAAGGDRLAAGALADFIYNRARFISRASPADVDDLAQDAFEKLLRAVRAGHFHERFDEHRNTESGYATATVYSVWMDKHRVRLRSGKLFDSGEASEGREVPAQGDLEQALIESQRRRSLEDALANLDADDRALLALKADGELTNAEIAKALGLVENTVKSRVHRLSQKLRIDLKAHETRSHVIPFPARKSGR